MKKWYKSIGIKEKIIDEIVFIEKTTEVSEQSSLDYKFKKKSGISTFEKLGEFCENTDSPILIGCSDIYFMGELILIYSSLEKKVDVDSNFIFTLN